MTGQKAIIELLEKNIGQIISFTVKRVDKFGNQGEKEFPLTEADQAISEHTGNHSTHKAGQLIMKHRTRPRNH